MSDRQRTLEERAALAALNKRSMDAFKAFEKGPRDGPERQRLWEAWRAADRVYEEAARK